MQVKKQQSELDMEQQTGSKSGKEYVMSPCSFNLHVEYIMWNAGLDDAKAGSKLPGEISVTSDMQLTPHLWQKVKN